MKRFSLLLGGLAIFAAAFALAVRAEDLYLNKNSPSSPKTGLDWDHAWTEFNTIQWGSGAGKVGAGDTLWIAGGTYTTSMNPAASGTSGSPINIKRVLASDAVPTAAAGWSASLDAMINQNVGNAITFTPAHVGEWIVIDGRTNYGWKINIPNGANHGIGWPDASVNNVTVKHLDLAGPGGPTAFTFSSDIRGMDFTAWNGSAWQRITNVVVQDCKIHGTPNLLYFANVGYSTIERCVLYDNWVQNSTVYHENVLITLVSDHITFRYNSISNWATEGIEFGYTHSYWWIYGNIWQAMAAGPYHRFLETQYQPTDHIYVYQNLFINLWQAAYNDGSGGGWSACVASNNIYVNSPMIGSAGWTHDFNWNTAANSEAHGVANGSTSTFVGFVTNNFTLKTNTGGTYAHGKGGLVEWPFNVDTFGTTNGMDGGLLDPGPLLVTGLGPPPDPPDTDPPVISGVGVITNVNAAQVYCAVNESATNWCEYGTSLSYGSYSSTNAPALAHTNSLAGLAANTAYLFRIHAIDTSGNASTATNVFTTLPAPPAATGSSATVGNMKLTPISGP